MEVQQAMDQFEQEADSQGDDVQLMDSQVCVICSRLLAYIYTCILRAISLHVLNFAVL